jgi:DNA-directed RNA polymerase I, II, and III subunit RPABC2
MSDNESNYDSDSFESDEESVKISNKKPVVINAAKKFGNYIEDESEVDDSEPDDADIEEDDEQVGGVGDYDDNEEEDEPIKKDEEPEDDAEPEEEDEEEIEIDEEGVALEKNPKTIKPKKTTQLIIDDNDEDEDEYDENYLQKFDNEINRNYIVDFHPECLNHNSDEVSKLSRVIRDENNIIIDPLHRTIPYLTKYEKARVLGQRAKQIETGSKPFVKLPENIIDSYVIAELELREKKIPFIIKRPIPGGAFEYWNLKDLEIINF